MTKIAAVVDRDGVLLLPAQQVLAALAYGLTIKEASEKLGWGEVSLSRWREAVQRHFGLGILGVLVRVLNEKRFDPALLSATFIKDTAAGQPYTQTVRALSRSPLSPYQVSLIAGSYDLYPRAIDSRWGTTDIDPYNREILAQAGIRQPRSGSYAMMVAAAAWLGQVTLDNLESPVKPRTLTFRHEWASFTVVGPPGTKISVTINGKTIEIRIPDDDATAGPAE
ncbi:MAG TPA: hypothetical protein VGH44_06405 [Candidatus Saccharimonadia bacterium]|jgi:hypothetical protein